METRKEAILAALDAFVRQRSGMDYRNYGDAKSYRAEQRQITKDLHQYRELRAAVSYRDGIDADALLAASRDAYSGRLTLGTTEVCGACYRDPTLKARKPEHSHAQRWTVDYCTGQYFPTEYRRAACAVLASALWSYTREKAMPETERDAISGQTMIKTTWQTPGDWLRAYFRKEFGRGIAERWFR